MISTNKASEGLIWLRQILSLDAEKAFNQVEHCYLHEVLSHLGTDNYFSTWIKILYNNLVASVATNNIISKGFNVAMGTHQSFPLFPLLFVPAIEQLVTVIWSKQNIIGINVNNIENKIRLFADYIAMFYPVWRNHYSLSLTLSIHSAIYQVIRLIHQNLLSHSSSSQTN